MTNTLTLSRQQLATFLTCQRRFQLRYQERLPWPTPPPDSEMEAVLAQGQSFHQLLQRHFLGLPVQVEEPTLRRWWHAFQQNPPLIPTGQRLTELSLTVPVGDHFLHGRFDLLVLNENEAHIFDWKTSKPQPVGRLRDDWQTRLYLALLAESEAALPTRAANLPPENVAITYWYVSEPETPRTIQYSQAWHEQNWTEIMALVAQISAQLSQNEAWPLTSDRQACQYCPYQVYCDRQTELPVMPPIPEDDEAWPYPTDFLEPNSP